jgi:CRP-like cAMP-binding protein
VKTTIQDEHLARKLAGIITLFDDELATISSLSRRKRKFRAGQNLLIEGQLNRPAYILIKGWTCSYKILADGSRQIVDFPVPGDFLGLRSLLFRTADHCIEPITDIEAFEVSRVDLIEAFAAAPRLATAVLWATSRNEAMVVEHLVNVGRRTANKRMAHLLLEIGARLRLVGLGTESGFTCPLSQSHLADALGLSAVHVNRTLRDLRKSGLLTFKRGEVVFNDYAGLVRLADFDTAYLDQDGPVFP